MREQRWTIGDLELFPRPLDDKRHEIIEGELYVSRQPHWMHQLMAAEIVGALVAWNTQANAGIVLGAPGVIFAMDEAVAPDVVWVGAERLGLVLGRDGKLHAAPDLVAEILSDDHWDRMRKLELYSRRGVGEYWVVDWQDRRVHVHRRRDAGLRHVATLLVGDILESPLLPGFRLDLGALFSDLPEPDA
jgi:Uma2 family endonuclease